MDGLLAITKALSDESRVRILLALQSHELCACQLTALLGLAPSTVSKHMAILRQAGLVTVRKDGRWVFYRVVGDEAPPMIRQALAWVNEFAGTGDRVREDGKRLKDILAMDKEELSRLG